MTVAIRAFQPGDEAAFYALNEAWIVAYFHMEEKDREILGDPQQTILSRGGHIHFAVESDTGEILGCCALLPITPDVFEIAKMTVMESERKRGIGRHLLRAVVAHARALGAARLYLETNHILTGAIALYRSEGFQHLRPEDAGPSSYARVDVFMQKFL